MFLPTNITLQFGDSGDYVAELQRRLVARQCLARGMITALYDGPTVSAVRTFQIAEGLPGDGVAGPETLRRLNGFFTEEESAAPGEDNEQATSRGPTLEQRINLQLEQQQILEREQKREEEIAITTTIQQQATLAHTQEQQLQQQQERLLARDQKQEVQRDQQQQMAQKAELEARRDQFFQKDQQAFIDKPIAKTIDDLTTKPEQDIGGQSRGPELSRDPTEGKQMKAEMQADRQAQQTSGISAPKEKTAERESPPEQGQQPRQPGFGQAPAAAAPAAPTPANPELTRISQQMESRLSPHVIQEVRQVGVVMMQSGVQQSQMPGGLTGPSGPERTPGMEERQAAQGGGRGV